MADVWTEELNSRLADFWRRAPQPEVGRAVGLLRELFPTRRAMIDAMAQVSGDVVQADDSLLYKWERGEVNPGRRYRKMLAGVCSTLLGIMNIEDRRQFIYRLIKADVGGLLLTSIVLPQITPSSLGNQDFTPDASEALDLAHALSRSSVAPQVLDELESNVVHVIHKYSYVAPASLVEWTRKQFTLIVSSLREGQSVMQRRRLCVIAGELAGLRGWLAHDLRQPMSAAALYGVAATAAREGENEALYAWVLGNHSRIMIYDELPRRALELTLEGIEHADGHASPRLKAWLLAQASRAHSSVKDHVSGAHALMQAERELDRANGEMHNDLVYFDECRLISYVGHHHLLAGNPRLAEPYLRRSLAQLRPEQAKHIALTRLDLATVLTAQGEVIEGCTEALAALNIPKDDLIDSVLRRALRFGHQVRRYTKSVYTAREVVQLIDSTAVQLGAKA